MAKWMLDLGICGRIFHNSNKMQMIAFAMERKYHINATGAHANAVMPRNNLHYSSMASTLPVTVRVRLFWHSLAINRRQKFLKATDEISLYHQNSNIWHLIFAHSLTNRPKILSYQQKKIPIKPEIILILARFLKSKTFPHLASELAWGSLGTRRRFAKARRSNYTNSNLNWSYSEAYICIFATRLKF